ncbi:class C sortase [Corynebacterium sp. CCM 9204]|uniref:class C sortase n=1 Tax=Corynebacterium sp. CCM 9204 TaxID=3057616 RepID=UPI003525163B
MSTAVVEPSPAPDQDQQDSHPRSRRQRYAPFVALAVALIGIAIMVYPVFATRHNDVQHQINANKFTVSVNNADPAELERSLQQADAYNSDLSQGLILDPFLEDLVPDTAEYQHYLEQLAVTDAMAVVKVPSAEINLPVYHGTSDEVLKNGVGHLFGSSLPVGGPGTHSVMTGHTALPNATLFDHLSDVKEGDAIYLNTLGRELKYVVKEITVVEPSEIDSLNRVPGRDLVTLITCTPYGINSHRLLVTGERVPLDPADEAIIKREEPVKASWTWWMISILVIGIAALIGVGGLIIRLIILSRRAESAASKGRHHAR